MEKDLPPAIAHAEALGRAFIDGLSAGLIQPGVTADEMREMLSTLTQGQEAGEQFKDWLVNLARDPLPADIVERAKQAIEDLNDARLADDLLAQWQQGDIAAHPWSEVRKGLEEE